MKWMDIDKWNVHNLEVLAPWRPSMVLQLPLHRLQVGKMDGASRINGKRSLLVARIYICKLQLVFEMYDRAFFCRLYCTQHPFSPKPIPHIFQKGIQVRCLELAHKPHQQQQKIYIHISDA